MEKEKTAVSTVGYLAESTVGDQARRADKIPAKLRRRAPVRSILGTSASGSPKEPMSYIYSGAECMVMMSMTGSKQNKSF